MARGRPRNSDRPITLRPQNYPTSHVLTIAELRRKRPVPQSAYVSVAELARELGVKDLETLRPLIDFHYLRILESKEYLADCIVGRPEPAALEWLKEALKPAVLRPFLTLEQAAALMSANVKDMRLLCLSYNIHLYVDPVFGEMLSIRNFHKLWNRLRDSRDGARFDRQAMLALLQTADLTADGERSLRRTPLPYSKRLEMEMIRISKLKEPERTLRAVAFYEAYRDTTSIMDCISRYRSLTAGELPEVEARLGKLMRLCVGESVLDA